MKTLVIATDGFHTLVDDAGKVWAIIDADTCYEIDMRIDNVEKLLISKSKMAKGRRRVEKNVVVLNAKNDTY